MADIKYEIIEGDRRFIGKRQRMEKRTEPGQLERRGGKVRPPRLGAGP